MSLLKMAWRNLMNRPVQTLITSLVVSIGVAMTLSIMMLSDGIKAGIVRASEPFGMIVGSKGSANQLVFNTIFMMDNPLSNIPRSYYESLQKDPRVVQAVPFALGDNYDGFRIVGTSADFFNLKGRPADPPYFQLAAGSIFRQSFEAVIGAKVAQSTGLKLGDRFVSAHGVARAVEPDEHEEHPYTVVGILRPVSAPSDQGIYVSMDSYWIGHEHEHEEEHEAGAASVPAGHAAGTAASTGVSEPHDDEEEDDLAHGVTAALIQPHSYMDLMQLYQQINQTQIAQAVFPGQVIAKIFDMMGSGEQLLKYISIVVLGVAGLTVVLALYGSALERRRTIAILRAIGAGRMAMVVMVLLESLLVVGLGCLGGALLGCGLGLALAHYISSQLSIAIFLQFQWELVTVLAAMAALGLAAGIVPAVSAYRTETARYLNAM